MIEKSDCAEEFISFNLEIENCARFRIYCAGPVVLLSPPLVRPGSLTTTEQGNSAMRMISEKAIAFILALALSGTAFDTFIV